MSWKTLFVLFLFVALVMITLTMTACSSRNYQTNIHEITEPFSNLSIKTDTANITFLPSSDGVYRVVCYEEANKSHLVEVQNGTLSVNLLDGKKWYDHIRIHVDSPKITVYLPEAEYLSLVIEESTGDVEISENFRFKSIDVSLSTGNVTCSASATDDIQIVTSTGDIYAENISAGSLDLTVSTGMIAVSDVTCEEDVTIGVSTGKTFLSNIACKNLTTKGTTGDISLKNVFSANKLSIERSTGDVSLESSDATELFIKTDTGNVKGSLLTDKIFITKTNTGRINVPSSITGGRCEIFTNTGNIDITVSEG